MVISSYETHVALIFLVLVVAFCFLLRGVIGAIVDRQPPWRRFGFGLASLALAVLLWFLLPIGHSSAEIERLEIMRYEVLTPALEDHRREHGRYPGSLQEAGLEAPTTPWGPLGYERRPDGDGGHYVLRVGDHDRNGFTASWDSRAPEDGWSVER